MRRTHARLAGVLRVAAGAAFALALGATALPAAAGRVLGVLLLGVLIGTPVLRVAWLTLRWWRVGDRRFASAGLGLLAVMIAGSAVTIALR